MLERGEGRVHRPIDPAPVAGGEQVEHRAAEDRERCRALVAAVGGGARSEARPGTAGPMRFGFDAQGYVGSVTSPLGRRWTIESGGDGQPRRLTTPSGSRLTYAYGADGQIARVLRGVPGAERALLSYEHDSVGRVTRTAYPDGTQATTAYLHEGDRGVLDPGVAGGLRPLRPLSRLIGGNHRATLRADRERAASGRSWP